ncbi:pyrroline-5-carboxylate reductase [Sulfidibacter corallicola]|uniref:Pyrroline-5-carboxylate reductase n=1 Tax=Sulfidibacter corallicola TaxID=2818388 RepID=A0A8A4TVK7_SULCO|nr:pyrroline-5-carboxylate reductase [Sulfidibacter corallicola]QTD53540.1 pyrroline-5-carboxylate reductase [Sulfidibacter corallicola]
MDTEQVDFSDKTVGVIGAGVMGTALLKGMLAAELLPTKNLRAAVATNGSRDRIAEDLEIPVACGYPPEWIADTDVFLLCVKPHRVVEILDRLKSSGTLRPHALIISIAAGTKIAEIESSLPGFAVIRAMPNTPCLIGAGVTVISPGNHVKPEHMAIAEQVFASVGKVWTLGEHHLDAVTAVSGSGPAYIYLMMESLADGAVKVGLPRDIAFQLVSQTMLGAAMMLQGTGKHPATLKDEVTTPAGCTISALLTMEDGRIRSTLARAVEEATRTAAGLGRKGTH